MENIIENQPMAAQSHGGCPVALLAEEYDRCLSSGQPVHALPVSGDLIATWQERPAIFERPFSSAA